MSPSWWLEFNSQYPGERCEGLQIVPRLLTPVMAHAYIDNTYTQSHVNKYNFKNHKTGSPEYKLGVWGSPERVEGAGKGEE